MPRASLKLRAAFSAAAWRLAVACAGMVLSLSVLESPALCAPPSDWVRAPYRIRITLAADASARPQADFEEHIRKWIGARIAASIGPLWAADVVVAKDYDTREFCRDPLLLEWDDLPKELQQYDKLTWLSVVAAPQGYLLHCREFDAYVRRAGSVRQQLVQQTSFVPEGAFQLLKDSFAPLAMVEADPEKQTEVQLIFKGSALARPTEEKLFVAAGDAYLPLLRRTDRSGKLLAKGGITEIPYTLLTAAAADQSGWLATVHSGMRLPFGAKRRGLVQQIAISLKNPHAASRVRFHARTDVKQGLAGYEVFREVEDAPPLLVGVTDRDGVISVPPGQGAVSTVLLRSEGSLLAKVPVPAGATDLIQTPIADDNVRLAAQSEARVVREELIDVVARRTIMIARIKAMLKAGRVDDAKKLMAELDELPTASTFAGSMDATQRRLPKSVDPQVQRAVDRLFASTRQLLSRFLDPRVVSNLQNEINSAQPGGS